MLSRLVFAAALLAAPMAAAQTAPPPSASDVAQARKHADAVILAGEAGRWFENITDDATPTIRHTLSGLTCRFTGGEGDRVVIFPDPNGGPPAGDDVGCLWYDAALKADYTLYATRYEDAPSAEAVLGSAARAIVNRWPDAKPFEGELAMATVEGEIEPIVAAYVVQTSAGPSVTLALVAHRDDWSFKVRATGPVDAATDVSLGAGLALITGMIEGLDDPVAAD